MSNRDRNGQPPCCDDSDCCSALAPGSDAGGTGWKTAIFTVVILLAVAVAAYSLFWRGDEGGNASGCVPGSAACAAACGGLPAIAGLEQELAGNDFALLVFPGPGDQLPRAVETTVSIANIAINARGARARRLTLHPDDPVYANAAEQFKVATFPAVLALGKTNSVVLTGSSIHEDTILRIYDQNSIVLPADCAPGGIRKK